MSIDLLINFVKENYRFIIDAIALVVALVLLIVRKKNVQSITAAIYNSAVVAVMATEQTVLKGKDKLEYAINIVKDELLKQFPKLDVNRYSSTIKLIIEAILETPQKH